MERHLPLIWKTPIAMSGRNGVQESRHEADQFNMDFRRPCGYRAGIEPAVHANVASAAAGGNNAGGGVSLKLVCPFNCRRAKRAGQARRPAHACIGTDSMAQQ